MEDSIYFQTEWTPGIGDPTFMGWFTVFAYLFAVLLAFRRGVKEYRVELCCWQAWMTIALVLLLLAINKQLDLQTWLAQTLRRHALVHGWYEDRRTYQFLFILGIVVMVPLFFASYIERIRSRIRDFSMVILGLTLLLVFVLLRASAFHNMDVMIGQEFHGIRLNWVLELGGIAVVILGIRRGKRRREEISGGWDFT